MAIERIVLGHRISRDAIKEQAEVIGLGYVILQPLCCKIICRAT